MFEESSQITIVTSITKYETLLGPLETVTMRGVSIFIRAGKLIVVYSSRSSLKLKP